MTPGLMAVMRKEIRQVSRDRRMMPMLIIAPVMQLIIFGFAVDFEVEHLKTVTCDLDGTTESRELLRRMTADQSFLDIGPATDCLRPHEDIRSNRAEVAVVVPRGYATDLLSGHHVAIQILADGSNPLYGRFARESATAAIEAISAGVMRERLELARGLTQVERTIARPLPQVRVFYNPRMKSALFMVPGVAAMILLIVTTIVMAMNLARERELGTLEQVIVTPLRAWELILGKVLPFVIIGCFDVLLVLTVGAWVFDVPVRGSLLLLALGTLLYILSTVGLGLFLSVAAKTRQQAFLAAFSVMMPGILLSGVMTPIENMPRWLQPLTYLNPIRYYVEILRGILLKGASLSDLSFDFAALAVFGVVILIAAGLRFSKRVD
jgi:ABC-2 type transport system permease protein